MGAPTSNVFINCPFDEGYRPIFDGLIFATHACGFRPRSALELDDGTQTRIDKLYRIIEDCRYGVHDLSRTELDPIHALPRFNMPLELGIFLGAKRFGDPLQRDKRGLILDVEKYRYQKFISDLSGMDIRAHSGRAGTAMVHLRDWLVNVSKRRGIIGGTELLRQFERFQSERPSIAEVSGLDPLNIPYADGQEIVANWLTTAT